MTKERLLHIAFRAILLWGQKFMVSLSIQTLDSGVRVAKLAGKMDIRWVNQVGDEFVVKIGSSNTPTIVDLQDVSFIASLGMRSLLAAARGVASHGGKLVLLKPQPLVKEALMVAGFDNVVETYGDFYQALAALDPARA